MRFHRQTTVLAALLGLGLAWGCNGAGTGSSNSTSVAPTTSKTTPVAPITTSVVVAPTTSSTPGAGGVSRWLFVANGGDSSLTRYDIDSAKGTLGSPYSFLCLGGFPSLMCTSPSGKFLFVIVAAPNGGTTNTVLSYAIDSNSGQPTLVANSTPTVGTFPDGIAVDPTGSVVVVADYTDDTLTALMVNQTTGALTAQTPVPLPNAGTVGAAGLAISPDSKFVYVTGQTVGNLMAFSLETGTGALAPLTTPAPITTLPNAAWVAMDHTGANLYVAGQDFSGAASSLYAFTRNAGTGALTANGSPIALTGATPYGITIDAQGKNLYVPCDGTNVVLAYMISATGALTANTPASATTGTTPVAVAVDASGKFAFAPDMGTDDIQELNVATTGALSDNGVPMPLPSSVAAGAAQASAVCIK